MGRIMLSVAYPLLSNFFTLDHNGAIFVKTLLSNFRENFIEHKTRVLIFSTTFLWKHFSFYEESRERDIYYHYVRRSSCKVFFILVRS